MSASKNKIFETTSFLSKSNSSYIELMYEKYSNSPDNVPESWRQYFEGINDNQDLVKKEVSGASWTPKKLKHTSDVDPDIYEKFIPENLNNSLESKITKEKPQSSSSDIESSTKDSVRAIMMIRAYRIRGHLQSELDPLELTKKEYAPELDPKTYGFTDSDMNKKIFLDEVLGLKYATLKEILNILKRTYCSNIGFEFMHMNDPEEKSWIQARIEGKDKEIHFTERGKKAILNRLIEADGFEKYLAKKYVGTKRFGLDGCEALIPAMEQIIKRGGALGCKEVKIGMPHRGRLNILTNVIQKPLKKIFKEFAGDPGIASGGVSGDVKYHLGASANREFDGNLVHVSLTANPSHLEAVNPVVLGQTRAKQDFHKDKDRKQVIPILLHGDAAFAGQGIVAECFAMSGLTGHNIGGTIHIIVNNQIGFTTQPEFSRSSPYPSEVAKMVQAPIFHVNGDDPEAVTYCAKIATEYRQKFNRDVVIDIFCYRKFGHNEGDEPSFTQPLMYKKIKKHESTLSKYSKQLIDEGSISEEYFKNELANYQKILDEEFEASKNYKSNEFDWFTGVWSKFTSELGQDRRGVTGVDIEKIKTLGRKLSTIPTTFNPHKTISRIFENRLNMLETGKEIDWALAETLALGTISDEGYGVRLVGQDSVRGTFSHRHAGINDQETGQRYYPIKNLSSNQGKVEIIDSLLSEMGVLGFEYGYSLTDPDTLVLWEAQFGDFANGAQVIFDQFISSGEKKWTRASGLVMLLPHGYEGQGPEHSSARVERYLQACAQENIQVVNCTTPANYFHALRRQLHRPFRKPLVVFTPKSLLRHKRCISEIEDFTKENSFHRVLSDKAEYSQYNMIPLAKDEEIEKVILCTGKIYYDLVDEREKQKANKVQLVRIEQLYPFPAKTLARHLNRFSNAKSFIWCQEEPQNMGCWNHVERYVNRTLEYINAKSKTLKYTGRKPSASPASGLPQKTSCPTARNCYNSDYNIMSTPILVPTLGESVTEATVAKWIKKTGDNVNEDEPIVELETDKVSVEVTSPTSGVLSEISIKEGETVGVGTKLGEIGEAGSVSAAPVKKEENKVKEIKKEEISDISKKEELILEKEALQKEVAKVVPINLEKKSVDPSPAAKRVIVENNLDVSSIQGTGKRGQILKSDLIGLMGVNPGLDKKFQDKGPEERVKMSRLRATIAKRLKEAQNTAAMLTTFNEVDMSMIMQIRKDNKEEFEKIYGVKLGFMSFFVKACVNALQTFPAVNAEIQGEEIVYKNYYNIGVAVGTDKGLVVPVVRSADQMSFADIEKEIINLGGKARDGQLSIEELQGGTFTITNGGIYGSMLSTPILNPPQSGVLGMHNIVQRPIVINGKIEIRPMMYLALSYDHRIIDGKEAVSFLVRVKEILEDPRRLFLNL